MVPCIQCGATSPPDMMHSTLTTMAFGPGGYSPRSVAHLCSEECERKYLEELMKR